MRPFILIFLVLISSFCFSQKTDLQIENLKGKIKTMSSSNYDVNIVEGQYKKGAKKNESFFDDIIITDYDTIGNKISETYIKTDNSVREILTFKYNQKHLLVEITKDKFGKEKFEYNEQNRLINHYDYDKNERIKNFTSYLYDKNGNLIEKRYANYISKHFYNPNKLLIRLEKYDTDEISMAEILKSKIVSNNYFEYKYDTENRISEEFEISKNHRNEQSYMYDNFGNILAEFIYIDKKSDGSSYRSIIRKYIYKYDEKGNWISRIQIVDKEPRSLDERKIEYY